MQIDKHEKILRDITVVYMRNWNRNVSYLIIDINSVSLLKIVFSDSRLD